MKIRWVFTRGDEQTIIAIERGAVDYVLHVRRPNRDDHRTSVPTALEAILRQAEYERELTWSGWHLAEYRQFGSPPSAARPLADLSGQCSAAPLASVSLSTTRTPVMAAPPTEPLRAR